MQQQMAEMQSAMQNKALQERMATLKARPLLLMYAECLPPNAVSLMHLASPCAAHINPEGKANVQDDPELAPMFEDIQKNGMQAMMKYWNDPKVLAKIGERMGDVSAIAASGAAATASGTAPAASAAPAPEIDSLLDAARYGQGLAQITAYVSSEAWL